MSVHRRRFVVARKRHKCYGCDRIIRVGEFALACTASPGSELAARGRWLSVHFCGECSQYATEYPPLRKETAP